MKGSSLVMSNFFGEYGDGDVDGFGVGSSGARAISRFKKALVCGLMTVIHGTAMAYLHINHWNENTEYTSNYASNPYQSAVAMGLHGFSLFGAVASTAYLFSKCCAHLKSDRPEYYEAPTDNEAPRSCVRQIEVSKFPRSRPRKYCLYNCAMEGGSLAFQLTALAGIYTLRAGTWFATAYASTYATYRIATVLSNGDYSKKEVMGSAFVIYSIAGTVISSCLITDLNDYLTQKWKAEEDALHVYHLRIDQEKYAVEGKNQKPPEVERKKRPVPNPWKNRKVGNAADDTKAGDDTLITRRRKMETARENSQRTGSFASDDHQVSEFNRRLLALANEA
jgi:hypothetical protein